MRITVYIGGVVDALADGKLLKQIPSFFPENMSDGVYTMDTATLPDELRETFEKEANELLLEK